MLDKSSKIFLKFLDNQPDKRFMYYDEIEYPDELGDEDSLFAIIRHLKSLGMVDVIRNDKGHSLGVVMSHTGKHRKEFTHIATKEYLLDNWIAIVALIVSVIALLKAL
jgi:hypothetical protein